MSRDSAFVSAFHAQLEDKICHEVKKAIDERTTDWKLRDKLRKLDKLVAEQEQGGTNQDREPVWSVKKEQSEIGGKLLMSGLFQASLRPPPG